MGDITKTGENSKLVGLIHGKGSLAEVGEGSLSIGKPFERDVFLFETFIAGTTHVEGISDIVAKLNLEDKLEFYREPENKYDEMAIMIKTEKGEKLGYVPKADNVVFARLMDAGKLLFGRLTDKETLGKWEKLKIKVYLHEY